MSSRNLRADFITGAAQLQPFQRYDFLNPDYQQMIQDRSQRPVPRQLLVQDLLEQHAHFREAEPVLANIRALADVNTFTVTTGHQLSLLGGPMYMLYKIATVIKLAEIIEAKVPGKKIVPVFWMASEDHDWEEINHFHPDYFETITYPGEFQGPVGRHILEPEIQDILRDVPIDLRSVYAPGRELRDAFRQLILKLFGKYGLVVIDGDRPALKRYFKPWMARELKGEGMGTHVVQMTAALEAAGYTPQVYPRALNLFYMGDGGRELLFRDGNRIFTQGGSQQWKLGEMLDLLEGRPEDFSPNVAMRPLYQEAILPNLAYSGGWAEVSYWHQLKAGFEAESVHYPLLVPRMTATLYRAQDAALLEDLGLKVQDVALDVHRIYDRYFDAHFALPQVATAFEKIEAAYRELAAAMPQVAPTLEQHLLARVAAEQAYREALVKKIRKNRRNQHPAPFRAMKQAKLAIQPDGYKQERVLNFTHFFGGDYEQLIKLVVQHCSPEKYTEQWIQLD